MSYIGNEQEFLSQICVKLCLIDNLAACVGDLFVDDYTY